MNILMYLLGVLQSINKNNDNFFGRDDEGIMKILCHIIAATLKN